MSARAIRNGTETASFKIKIDRIEPIKGAVENRAPVRAVPILPNDIMNATRLTPIPRNPNSAA